jgi:CheY-like chemotaxis protein
MGGSIRVESTPGKGSSFTFSILGQPDGAAPQEDPPHHQDLLERLAGKKALIIEYGAASRGLLASWLGDLGMQVTAFSTPREADLGPGADDFAVAFLRFPKADRDAVHILRALRQSAVPIVSLAAVGDAPTARRRARLAGQLLKPITLSAFEEILGELCGFPRELAEPSEPKSDGDHPPMPPLEILVAEDNPVNQMVTLMMLERLGYQADMVADGYEVISALEQQHYDVVLMDIQMPGMDGLEAARIIREELHSPVYLIAFSANAEAGMPEGWWLEAGMNAALMKPVLLEDLRTALARCRPIEEKLAPSKPLPDTEACPFSNRCPMFPLFENEPIKKVYQTNYCFDDFTTCQRYHLASSGNMPDPRLLPDGKMLPHPGKG